MDWNAAVEKHRTALKRVLAGLLVTAGFAAGARGGAPGTRPATLPRHLHRAVLRLLRPAEAAVRRLVIVAARGIVVEMRHPRSPGARKIYSGVLSVVPPPLTPPHKGEGVASASESPSPLWGGVRGGGVAAETLGSPRTIVGGGMPDTAVSHHRNNPEAIGFRLFDPPSRWGRTRPRKAQVCVPRIGFPGLTKFAPVRLPPMPGDPIDTTPLARRLVGLGHALDDLP